MYFVSLFLLLVLFLCWAQGPSIKPIFAGPIQSILQPNPKPNSRPNMLAQTGCRSAQHAWPNRFFPHPRAAQSSAGLHGSTHQTSQPHTPTPYPRLQASHDHSSLFQTAPPASNHAQVCSEPTARHGHPRRQLACAKDFLFAHMCKA